MVNALLLVAKRPLPRVSNWLFRHALLIGVSSASSYDMIVVSYDKVVILFEIQERTRRAAPLVAKLVSAISDMSHGRSACSDLDHASRRDSFL